MKPGGDTPNDVVGKVIVTNATAMQDKYGTAGWAQVEAEVRTLIAADSVRGLTSRLVALDSAADMLTVGATPVVDVMDEAENKAAVDAVFAALTPDYLMILGAQDVVPHQPLLNPLFDENDPFGPDPDEEVPSDLPYACDAVFDDSIQSFIGPTRVVGRMPGIVGAADPAALISLLTWASSWRQQSASTYRNYFAVTAKVWQDSTKLSVRRTFGSSASVHLSPPKGPAWTSAELQPLMHFINCHGGPSDPIFYGQQGSSYPEAHRSDHLPGLIREGTVAAAECCYGAELYEPIGQAGIPGICNRYLMEGAYGFLGSSTIAYGPKAGNGQADLICQYFLKHVLAGASTGRALLQARQDYVKVTGSMDPVDLKTMAQFHLLGDPSIHPVDVPDTEASSALPKAFASRRGRRGLLAKRGSHIRTTTAGVERAPIKDVSASARRLIEELGLEYGLKVTGSMAFNIKAAKSPKKARSVKARKLAQGKGTYYVVFGERFSDAPSKLHVQQVVLAKEVNGMIEEAVEVLSKRAR